MKKLSALIVTTYLTQTSFVLAADPLGSEGDIAHELAEGVYAAEKASKGGLPQFEPTWFVSQFFWLALAFAAMYFVFSKITLPSISNVIENRKNMIDSDLDMAEKLTSEADTVQNAYQDNLSATQADAMAALSKSEEKTKAKYDKKSEEFREKSEAAVLETEQKIEAAKAQAMTDMSKVITDVASDAIQKIIGTNPDSKKIQAIVENLDSANQPTKKVKAA